MSARLGPTQRYVAWVAGALVLGLLIGIGVAVASSPASFSKGHQSSGFVAPSPVAVATPSATPTVGAPGKLGNAARLLTNGSGTVIAFGGSVIEASTQGGATGWTQLHLPDGASGVGVDPANPQHAVIGGTTIQITNDGGQTWTPPLSVPPKKGPYVALTISPLESKVWFFWHQGRLLVTTDASYSTWTDLTTLPAFDVPPIVVAGQALGEFYVADGARVFRLTNYTQAVGLPNAPGSVSGLAVIGGSETLLTSIQGKGVYAFRTQAWTKISDLTGPIAGGSSAAVVGNGGAKLGVAAEVSYSLDGGQTWAKATGLPRDQTVEALAGQPGSLTFYAYCYGGDLYVSADGGKTWSRVSQALRS